MSTRKGRKRTTGRFTTREELVEAVRAEYYGTKRTIPQVARFCGVSVATVTKILNTGEGRPVQSERAE